MASSLPRMLANCAEPIIELPIEIAPTVIMAMIASTIDISIRVKPGLRMAGVGKWHGRRTGLVVFGLLCSGILKRELMEASCI